MDTDDKGMYFAVDVHKQDARKDDIVQQMNNKKLQYIVVGGHMLLPSASASKHKVYQLRMRDLHGSCPDRGVRP